MRRWLLSPSVETPPLGRRCSKVILCRTIRHEGNNLRSKFNHGPYRLLIHRESQRRRCHTLPVFGPSELIIQIFGNRNRDDSGGRNAIFSVFGGIKHRNAITPVCCDVYLDGTARINREFSPIFEMDFERQVVSLQLGNSPDRSHFRSPVGINAANTSILRRFLYCLKLRITSRKKLFTIQHTTFQIDGTSHECFALLDASRRHVISSPVAGLLIVKHLESYSHVVHLLKNTGDFPYPL